MAYAALLERILEDRHITHEEGDALVELATHWGLTPAETMDCHNRFIAGLSAAALADGIVTTSERRDLHLVSRLLGIDPTAVNAVLDNAITKLSGQTLTAVALAATSTIPPSETTSTLTGKKVCFTGELLSAINGKPLTRDHASSLARAAGLEVVDSVTRSTDILVLADPLSQSGKAKKARSYGVTVMHEVVFWRSLSIAVD